MPCGGSSSTPAKGQGLVGKDYAFFVLAGALLGVYLLPRLAVATGYIPSSASATTVERVLGGALGGYTVSRYAHVRTPTAPVDECA